MQTTEEEEKFRQIRQLSQFLRGGARIQVLSFQSKALVFSIVPCFLGLKRFGTRGCKNHIIGVLYPGGLQTSHDGALLPLKVVESGVIHKGIRKEHCGLAYSKNRDKEESEKRAHAQRYLESRIKSQERGRSQERCSDSGIGEVLEHISGLAGAQPQTEIRLLGKGKLVFCRKELDFKVRQEVHAYNPSAWEAEGEDRAAISLRLDQATD